jgi:hypothetical protein
LASNAGKPKALVGGVFFFGYFLLDTQKKVSRQPGETGGFAFKSKSLQMQAKSKLLDSSFSWNDGTH